jgi:Bacterial pre-peptidase C-terminal domain/Trypsin
MPLNQAQKPDNRTPGLIVGFGRTGGDNYDYGIKRTGAVTTSQCSHDKYSTNLVCWNYDAVVKKTGASNTCNADSGGGLHIGSDELVAGVTSGGLNPRCLEGDNSYDTDVASYFSPWISKMRGDASKNACGNMPVIDVEEHVRGEEAALNESSPIVARTFDVAAGTAALRVALNGEDDGHGKNDFDLYLIKGESGDVGQAVCSEDGAGQFGFCEVLNPAPGPWTAVVKRKKGEGLMQLVVTRLPSN